jgi:hypothetical protein
MKKRMIQRNEEWKHMRGWTFGPYFLASMALNMNSLAPPKKYFISNLGPNNDPKKCSKFLVIGPKIIFAPTPNLKWPKFQIWQWKNTLS